MRGFSILFRSDLTGFFSQTAKGCAHRAKYGVIRQMMSQNQGVGSDMRR